MSKQEMLVLSTKDRDRLKILHEVKRKHLTQRAAAQQLGVSDRWVKKLLRRVKKEGDRGVVHRLRGGCRTGACRRRQALKLVEASPLSSIGKANTSWFFCRLSLMSRVAY